jgi:hypothetical protein
MENLLLLLRHEEAFIIGRFCRSRLRRIAGARIPRLYEADQFVSYQA